MKSFWCWVGEIARWNKCSYARAAWAWAWALRSNPGPDGMGRIFAADAIVARPLHFWRRWID